MHSIVEMSVWKLKDTSRLYSKSECNATKHSLNRACISLFWEVKLFHVGLWQTTPASTSKLYAHNTSIGNSKFNASTPVDCIFPTFSELTTWLELSRVKLYRNDLRENNNYFELARGSSSRGFELPRVTVWRKSRANQFELVRVRVIGSQQLYILLKVEVSLSSLHYIMFCFQTECRWLL